MFSRNFFECLQPGISSFLLFRVDITGLQIINVNSDDVDNQFSYKPQQQGPTKRKFYAENSLVQLTGVWKKKAQITVNQPRSQGSLLLVPTEQERRRLGEKTWEQGWLRT